MFLRRHPERPKTEAEKKIDYTKRKLRGLEIKERVQVKGRKETALPEAEEIEAREVEAKYQALSEAKNCKVEIVKAGYSAFSKAENCEAKNVEAGWYAFPEAKNCKAESVKTTWYAFSKAENCEAKNVETTWYAFPEAKNCKAETVKTTWYAFSEAKNCKAETVESKWYAFPKAENCLVIKKVNAKEIGKDSLGVVVLGDIKGEAYPSVILMKGRVEDSPEEMQKYFIEELKKSQQEKESIFDYLSLFNWEGDTLKEGEKVLKERYDRVIEKIGGLEELRKVLGELRKYNFYFLIGDNSKREEIFFGFKELKEEDKKALLALNKRLSQLEKIRNYLSALSLEDWVKLGEHAGSLSFNKEEIEAKIKEGKEAREAILDSL